MKLKRVFNSLLMTTLLSPTLALASNSSPNKYHLLSIDPYSVVAPILSNDPTTSDRLAGQFYYNLTTGSFNAIDSTGAIVTLGSTTGAQPPSISVLTGGTTYTTPAGAKYLRVRMVGGGGGGGGAGTGAGNGGDGADTTFGSLTAGKGSGAAGFGGDGGTATGCDINIGGGMGVDRPNNLTATFGASGGTSFFGGSGQGGGNGGGNGAAAKANSGSGGGGGGANTTAFAGSGGGAGAFCEKLVQSPLSATYTYSVGSGGTAGSAGTGGGTGGVGAAGMIVVEAYFQ